MNVRLLRVSKIIAPVRSHPIEKGETKEQQAQRLREEWDDHYCEDDDETRDAWIRQESYIENHCIEWITLMTTSDGDFARIAEIEREFEKIASDYAEFEPTAVGEPNLLVHLVFAVGITIWVTCLEEEDEHGRRSYWWRMQNVVSRAKPIIPSEIWKNYRM
jgi:hypothetical protein